MHGVWLALIAPSLVFAHPHPQDTIDVEAMMADYDAAATTLTEVVAAAMTNSPLSLQYDQAAAIGAAIEGAPTMIASASVTTVSSTSVPTSDNNLVGRAICPPQAVGYGPTPSSDTPQAFTANIVMAGDATNAPLAVGAYNRSFVNLTGSNQQLGYLTYTTLKSYDVSACASRCDSLNLCLGFNIYFERAPTVDPNDESCADPASTTLIKCALYGYPVYAATATNVGQYRNNFQVVITGSNGYSKHGLPAAPAGFSNPAEYRGAIRSYKPGDVKYITYKGYTGPVDVSVCAAACQAVTRNDREHPYPRNATSYDACNFFNIWVGVKSDVPIGWTCSMYVGPPNRADMDDNYGQGALKVVNSIGYTASPIDAGVF